MHLTRTKLLAAGVLLAGVLTTGVSVLSRADAQQPKANYDDAIRKYYDALRTEKATPDRWEYKFIPVDKPLTTADLQTVLSGADREGWNYCGSQELAVEKTGKILPHMVFKRPKGGAAVGADAGLRDLAERERAAARAAQAERDLAATAQAEKAALERALREREALSADLIEQVRKQEAAVRDQQAQAEKARAQALQALRQAEDKAVAEAGARDAEKLRQRELEALRARYEETIRKLEAELKARPAGQAPRGSSADLSNIDPNTQVSVVVRVQHLDGKAAVAALAKAMPDAHIVNEVNPAYVVLSGPLAVVTKGREAILRVDVPATGTAKATTDGREYAAYKIKWGHADEVAKQLTAKFPTAKFQVLDNNTILVHGPLDLQKDLKKLIGDFEEKHGPGQ